MSNPPRNVKKENEYLRKVLAMRRKFQHYIDVNIDTAPELLTERFTLGKNDWSPVTRDQKRVLMEMAPEDVRKANK